MGKFFNPIELPPSTLPDEEEGSGRTPQSTVWISYIENKALEERFNEKKMEFQKKGLNSEILLYHGTSSANTDSICKTNFRIQGVSVRFAHGCGIYLSRDAIQCCREIHVLVKGCFLQFLGAVSDLKYSAV